jgi:hypothetical protein
MDGGSGINVLYALTLNDMGISRSKLRLSTAPFHEVVPGMEALPIGRSICLSRSGTCETFAQKPSPSKWWGSWGCTPSGLVNEVVLDMI